MASKFFKKIGIVALAVFLFSSVGVYIQHDLAQAYVRYGPAAQLNTGDIKSSHILDGTILSGDMANYNSFIFASSTIGNLTATSSISLPNGSITSANILDETVADNDISTSAGISATKIYPRGLTGALLLSDGTKIATSTTLKYATSSADLYVLGGKIHASSTNFNGVNYTWPSADGINGDTITTNGGGTLAWTPIDPVKLKTSFTADMAISAGDAVIITGATASSSEITFFAGASELNFGETGSQKQAESFATTTGSIGNQIEIKIKKNGTPTDNAVISIYSDSAGNPGTDLASTTLAGGTITTSFVQYTLSLNKPTNITANTTYHIVFSRSGSISGTDYYATASDAGQGYTNGSQLRYNGSVWANSAAEDINFGVKSLFNPGYIYKASAWATNPSTNFIGLANTSATASSSVDIIFCGQNTNLSGLTPGQKYYLSNTYGSLGTTAGNVSVYAGIAQTANNLLVTCP